MLVWLILCWRLSNPQTAMSGTAGPRFVDVLTAFYAKFNPAKLAEVPALVRKSVVVRGRID